MSACVRLSQLQGGQQLQQVAAVHVVKVKQEVLTVARQLDGGQLDGSTTSRRARARAGAGTHARNRTLSRMWMLVKYSDGT